MSLDTIIRGANLPDGRTGIDIGIKDGRIAALEPALAATAAAEIDATGRLVTPPFVDAHFHMDATLALTATDQRNQSGTLFEGIRIWAGMRPDLTQEAIVGRALTFCRLAAAQGLLAVRSHVDVTDRNLVGVEALLQVRREVASFMDLQLVAFPQAGFLRDPNNAANLERALDLGVDVVGGIPHFERTEADGAESVRQLCRIAADRGLLVDLHCDETDDPASRFVERLAAETVRHGLQGRVSGSHLCSMHSFDNQYFSKLLGLLVEADLCCIANPLANMHLQGRYDTYPKRRGMMRVDELNAAGLKVALGHDSVMDPWYPLGNADMLEVASMGAHAGHMTGEAGLKQCFAGVTTQAAAVMGLGDYGLAVGAHADLVVLQAANVIEAIRIKPARLHVMRRGRVIARTAPVTTELNLPEGQSNFDAGVLPAGPQ
ncbi:cytosine deaminase [Zavarzinia sp. CC-PAN008]|uniref:cytosine deaminase n=1 Tax=Zavarzinia sp. CC-PAN008 TaxID=3243332 RepID=UPI003F7488D7